jgi:hypothetical protein
MGGMGPPPPELQSQVNTWFVLSIISIVLCGCVGIPGIVATVNASGAKRAMEVGDYFGAQSKINTAKIWAIIGLVLGGLGILAQVARVASGDF